MDVRAREAPSMNFFEELLDRNRGIGLSESVLRQCLIDIDFPERMSEEVRQISVGLDEILRAASSYRNADAITFVSTPENHFGTGFPLSQKELTQIVTAINASK
jgi:hypothetical protein